MRVGFVITGAILLVIGGILAATLFLAIWGIPLVIIGIILIIIGAATSTHKQKMAIATAQSGAYTQALNELNDQLAKGTITKGEYKKRKKTMLK